MTWPVVVPAASASRQHPADGTLIRRAATNRPLRPQRGQRPASRSAWDPTYLWRSVEPDAISDARHADLATVVRVALPEHLDCLRSKCGQPGPASAGVHAPRSCRAAAQSPCSPPPRSSTVPSLLRLHVHRRTPARRCRTHHGAPERRRGARSNRRHTGPGSAQRATSSYPRIDRLHHLQQRTLTQEPSQMPSGRIGLGHDDVRGNACAGKGRAQPGVPQPRRSGRLSERTAGAVEADADEIQGLPDECHLQSSISLQSSRTIPGVASDTLEPLSRKAVILAR